MKKMALKVTLLFIIGAIVYSIFIVVKHGKDNPYSGKYTSKRGNIVLILNNNNDDCTIIDSEYRDVFSTKAKYSIRDNKIKINIKDKYNYTGKRVFKGIVQGNTIKLEKDIYYRK
ncbi:hypothetical protein [Clostridium felsineum]|uniref:hypothetical protein n=1 Tax=Clostridium felsineum TaxID=36839 RepID=UPI00098C5C0D|nr:hypothetical protein [Clostridium felsineum]URZ14222.1 hypothetical protein CLFE_002070 [Clostridium felsineum DSM 794]